MEGGLLLWGLIKKKSPPSYHLAARTIMIDAGHAALKKRAGKAQGRHDHTKRDALSSSILVVDDSRRPESPDLGIKLMAELIGSHLSHHGDVMLKQII
jgi:hypothetical protein